jgi:hypothetical protein
VLQDGAVQLGDRGVALSFRLSDIERIARDESPATTGLAAIWFDG